MCWQPWRHQRWGGRQTQACDDGAGTLTAEEGWETIHAAVDGARGSMYLADSAAILLLWGVITSKGYLSMYTVYALVSGFADRQPWFSALLFGIMTRVVIALAGVGFAAAYFVPHYLLGEAALLVSGVLCLATFGLASMWIRKTGEW